MLVTYVITAVIVYLVYTVLKIRIEEWHVGTKMNRLSLKKKVKENVSGDTSSSSPTDPYRIIEISSEESDTSSVHKVSDSDQESELSPSTNEKDGKENLMVFQQSTDSIQSEEDVGQLVFNASSSSTIPMFKWNKQKPLSNTNNIETHVSDSSDESNSESSYFQQQPRKKKHKVFQNNEQTNENESKEHKEETVSEVSVQYKELISGITVMLPVKPYRCQRAVMGMVIKGCLRQQNCLLESPTGSGKTLALLCSVLAWHDQYTADIQKKITAGPFGIDDDELSAETKFMTEFGSTDKTGDFDDMCRSEQSQKIKIPKIYYGTRTHAQIEQIVRELKKTCYKHKKMTILSSRKHTCIQESTKNKTDLCNDLLDISKNIGCPYYKESNKKMLSNFPAVERRGLPTAWDIEDLVAIGRNESVCPYFTARNLMEYADIIFCPYNYILDPDIRESMQLDLKDQVIILDEAHNIENVCREAASVEFRDDLLVAAANECDSLGKQRAADLPTYESLRSYILSLANLLKNISLDTNNPESGDKSSTYWSSEELIELFNMHQLGEPAYTSFLAASNAAIADSNKAKDENRQHLNQKSPKPVISNATKSVIDHLMFAMRMIKSPEFANDFRACVLETVPKDLKSTQDDTWYSTDKRNHRVRILKFICMNPAVTFSPLERMARSMILASGTLTPTLSFQSELGTSFEHILNTGHVIPKEQVYVTCVPKGPTQFPLKANYQNVNTWAFQDELGQVLLDVCESVPHGILCFFSSYSMMHKQLDRWRKNQIWNKITKIKEVFIEPRSGDDLKDLMKNYRNIISTTSAGPKGTINGALLLAVFRGKVAEGTDFKDDEARCVLAVGIPYAVRNNPVIDMKYKYNDMNGKRGLLSGSDWYTTQAFRALNQALGRCLRHFHDWGAVLLVDERFLLLQNKKNLPKWIKMMWASQNNYSLRENLRNFVAKQKEREEKEGRASI